ncbi:MAG: S8 family serine peptidase [Acidiferrobacterales bacterium]|nr:S8 family serine peptidase [Acidiferrobacterales bacterium]
MLNQTGAALRQKAKEFHLHRIVRCASPITWFLIFGLWYFQPTYAFTLSPEEHRVIAQAQTACQKILSDSELPKPEPILFRQQKVGERYQFQFEDRFAVRLDHVRPSGQQERFVAEISAPTTALRLAPVIFLGMDPTCALQQGRYLEYQGDIAVTLDIFSADFQSLRSEPLNPPLPILTGASATQSVLVALVDSGVNYQLPQIQLGLARDQFGNMLGYDFWDLDSQFFDSQAPGSPFFVQRHGTRTASILMEESPAARVVSYRYPRPDMTRMKALVTHADSLGVRIIGMPLGSRKESDWLAFEQAAKANPHILFVVSAGNNGVDIDSQPIYPASLDIDNMVVVTSADDFIRPAERTNWGKRSVDFSVPAESVQAIDFSGDFREVSGSSYAVSRVAALAANILSEDALLSAKELIERIKSFALPAGNQQYISTGYIPDPRAFTAEVSFKFVESTSEEMSAESDGVDVRILLLDERWNVEEVQLAISAAAKVLSTCKIAIQSRETFKMKSDAYLKDLSVGTAHTVLSAFHKLRPVDGTADAITLVFARDSRMHIQYEAEAFGEGNTRSRPWLKNSLWVALGARDLDVTIAHELFHILSNDGRHVADSNNLMSAETSGNNVELTDLQCQSARQYFG